MRRTFQLAFKYLFDRILSLIGLIILSPIFFIIWLTIKMKMPDGPVFFKQRRVGKSGITFTLIKFRTMFHLQNGSSVSVSGDSRITQLGALLRRYKLDELPELWNVLCGEMSFVGPRPDVPGYVDVLTGKDRDILRLRPGITGPASLKYANEEEILASISDPIRYNDEVIFPDKVKINLEYYHNHTFFGDLKLIIQTIFRNYENKD